MVRRRNPIVRLLRALLLILLLGVVLILLFVAVNLLKLDAWHDFNADNILAVDQTTILYDQSGDEIIRLHGTEDRICVSLEDIPKKVQEAFISAEDARFYEHSGVDFIRIAGAAWEDIKAGGYAQGASTMSQQLIKLSHLSADKTMSRKLEEAVLAYQMEQKYSKDEILEMYLNYVYFGGGYYGIEAAAMGYFGVHASELSIAQGAMLAGILKSPTNYAPHIDLEASTGRRNVVLSLMEGYGYISTEEREAAAKEEAVIVKGKTQASTSRGYYEDTVLRCAMEILDVDMSALMTSGYRIYTAEDPELQAYCEALFQESDLFPADDVEAAIVIEENGGGLVRALMGGRTYTSAMSFNRAVDIRRQPGSVIKPIIAYAPALEYCSYTAATMLLDEPTTFADYAPKNSSGKYYGWVTLREAVKRSLNIPAVKVLQDIGLEKGMEFAQACGIEFDETDGSLALALGGFKYGVSPLQIAGAYSCFASGGTYSTPSVIERITDVNGKVLYEYEPEEKRVMSEENAYILTSMLESVIEEGTGHRLGELEIPIAGKTGTVGDTEGNRDAWMASYTADYTAVVWMGYDNNHDGTLPTEATGGMYPALVLSRVYEELYKENDYREFTTPTGVNTYKIDAKTLETQHEAVLANALTPQSSILEEIFLEGTQPDKFTEYWAVPSAARKFSAIVSQDGKVEVNFTITCDYALYRLYREDPNGNAELLESWSGVSGQAVSYTDAGAKGGRTYGYYVVPVHKELVIGSKHVYGPSTLKKNVTVPEVIIDINILE